MGILIGVFSVAIFSDLRRYKIPNACVSVGIIAGLIVTGISYSVIEVMESLVNMIWIFMAFYPFYLLGGIGAGDIKLFMMTACYLRGNVLFRYMTITIITAAVWSVVKMLLFTECRERLFYLGRYLKKVVLTGTIDTYMVDKSQKRALIRMSVPAFLGLLILGAQSI